ncbi:CaiB/BaiF CoA transferase family protein [Falsiroseomonas sp. HC035]|uniref:CaiB/BaiF CoA transferase family protein n=1 Tax=Falsiroseomonas sp. HC035 TaxID=3390999 RepID=UPI003D315AA2
MTPAAPKTAGALDGLRVLDLGTFIAAPFAATMFAEMGAEVVKVELPGIGDHCRRLGTPTEHGDTLVWLSEGRNKRSVTIDLRKPEGAALLLRLAAQADAVCENFQVGTLEKWGLGWDQLRAANPRLVLLRISGYGQEGPYAARPCFGRIANAFGGISFLSGEPDRPPANPGSATLADYMAGLFGGFAMLAALRHRDRSGRGQVVDVALYEGVFRILDELVPAYDHGGHVRERAGAETAIVAPHSHYPTADGRWVAIACTSDTIFARLAQLIGAPDLAQPGRWATTAARVRDRVEVNATVSAWTRTLTRDALLSACEVAQVPAGPVYAIDEIFADPHYAARGSILRVADPRAGDLAVPAPVGRMSETPAHVAHLGQALGAETDAVLQGWLGMTAGEIAALRERGAV